VAGITGPGSFCALLDIMHRSIPVIWDGIEIFHFNTRFHERITYGWDNPQRGDLISVSWIPAEDKTGFGSGSRSLMAIETVSILRTGMAAVTADLVLVNAVSSFDKQFFRFDRLMAIRASRPILDGLLRQVLFPITMKFPLFMAVHAHHSFLIMNVRRTAIFTREFRIDATAVAERAGFSFIFFYEFMSLNEAETDPGNSRRFYMAPSTGSMAATARFLENMLVEGLEFGL